MKKLTAILSLFLISYFSNAQAPQATSYQAVIRNSSGNVLSNQLVKVRFSIHDSAANGTIVYRETQTPTTNAQGLISLFAGQGTPVTGTFSGINWGSKSKYLQTEIDITGGSNYTDMGTTQLMSVPYALHSNNGNPSGTNVGEMLYWNGSSWIKLAPGSYGQSLVLCEGIPTWGGCLPKVNNTSIAAITLTSAIGGGNISSDGGSPISAKGVCWSNSANPTIALATKSNEGSGSGVFSGTINGLIANTTYHLRAYAINNIGVAYGPDISFTTNNSGLINLSNVTIGSQIWANKNLNVPTYRNGDPIPQVTDASQWRNLTTGAWCWYDNDSATYSATYGRLYNWYAVNDPRGLAPTGWRIPVVSDWKKLIKFVDFDVDTTTDGFNSRTANAALKNVALWDEGQDCNNGLNSVGFSAMPSGYRAIDGSFRGIVSSGNLWYGGEYSFASGRNLNISCFNSLFIGGSWEKQVGLAVRVLKDTNISFIATAPSVTTNAITNLLGISATAGGNVTNSGGAAVTARGICWSTLTNPTISLPTKTLNGQGGGSFTSAVSELVTNTTYFVRAYATNSAGTTYGNQVSFTTPQLTLPSVTTSAITIVSSTSATSGGNITSNGGDSIIAKGVCWSISPNPTIALTTKTSNGTGVSSFSSNINGLTASTTNYVRAYATNSTGTSYGSQLTFTTVVNFSSITIGTQIWSSKNLDVRTYRNGDVIPQVTDSIVWSDLTTGAWCWYKNDSATYAATYGRLYNWYAVNDPRGLAPLGWHVSTDVDWNKLVKSLDAGADTSCLNCIQSFTAGGTMKSTTVWTSPNTGASNSSGFAGLPGGYRNDNNGVFINIGNVGSWWISRGNTGNNGWSLSLFNVNSNVKRESIPKVHGLSVRVVRD